MSPGSLARFHGFDSRTAQLLWILQYVALQNQVNPFLNGRMEGDRDLLFDRKSPSRPSIFVLHGLGDDLN